MEKGFRGGEMFVDDEAGHAISRMRKSLFNFTDLFYLNASSQAPQEITMPIAHWLDRLCQLNVSRSAGRGSAPHKPLLLLCLIDMVEDGSLTTPLVDYTPELFFRFQSYWPLVYARQQNQPDMRLPFHALGGERDQIWTRLTANG